jgi:adenosylcobinamide-GDP ribazoletransferase
MKAETADTIRQRTEELGVALGLLTRFPLPEFTMRTPATVGTAFWAYPLAGALVGAPAAALFWLCHAAGFSTAPSVLLAMAATLLASGAFHEDGLTDFWDGLGGGDSREEKLDIMRDSRIGTYGALAIAFTLGLQFCFLVNIQNYAGHTSVMGAIIAAEALSRGAIALPIASLHPARNDGLGPSMAVLPMVTIVTGVVIAAAIAVLLLGGGGLLMMVGAALGTGLVTFIAWHFLGGFTGDVLGAAAVTARMAGLGAFALAVTP